MAQADNTLGAPTEGLGQTVTFAAQGGRGVPQTSSKQRQAIRNNQTGGGAVLTARALQIPDSGADATYKALAQLGGEAIRPHLEAERTAAYVQGMQKAAQGQAITEIVAEQPWYSKLFGSTSLVDGARAYTASSKASSIAADIEAKMPELRKLSAEEFGAYSTKRITDANTGDAATDMMLAQQVSATLPAVMKGQAKEHLRFQQEQFEGSIRAKATASFAYLGTVSAAARKPGAVKEDADVLGAAIGALDVFTVPGEMKKELHDKLIAESAIQSITDGNFDTYKLMQDSGKLASMDPTAAYHVQRAYQQASGQAKMNVPDQLLQKVAEFRTLARRPGITDEDILAAGKAIDEEYQQMTGDPGSFVGNAATVAELQQLREYQDARQAQLNAKRSTAVTQIDKELAKVNAIQNLATRVVAGDGTSPYLMLSQSSSEQQEVFDHLRATASPQVRMRVLVDQAEVAIDKVEKNQTEAAIATALRAGDPSLLHRVYVEKYLPLVRASGDLPESVAQQYAGKYGEQMARYHALAHGQPADATSQGVFYNEVVAPQAKPMASTPRNKAIVDELTTGRFMSLFKTPIKDPEGYAAILEPTMKSYLAVPDAIADAKLNRPTLSLVGGYHWQRSTQATDLTRWIAGNKVVGGVAPDNLDKAMNLTVDKSAAEAGIEGAVKIGQTVDTPSGEPQLYLMGLGSDGQTKIKLVRASELHTNWKAGVGRLTKDDLQFGPELTNLPDDEQPSIYAPASEWQAYRAKKAAKPK